ncbi:MAG: hypothetical protein WKF91_16275 [Segetibacter sp.]
MEKIFLKVKTHLAGKERVYLIDPSPEHNSMNVNSDGEISLTNAAGWYCMWFENGRLYYLGGFLKFTLDDPFIILKSGPVSRNNHNMGVYEFFLDSLNKATLVPLDKLKHVLLDL